MKYLRKAKAEADPIYQKIVAKCIEELVAEGVFEKRAVMEACNISAFADAIRWDYIKEIIERDTGGELIPLRELYFHGRRKGIAASKKNDIEQNPEKYAARGQGQRTAGYANVSKGNESLLIEQLRYKNKVAAGTKAKTTKLATEIIKCLPSATNKVNGILEGPKTH